MKLLFDQNLSRKLVKNLARQFPYSSHVVFLDLEAAGDSAIWAYARRRGFVIVTRDADFNVLSASQGSPPKVVWLRIGNAPTEHFEALLKEHAAEIRHFAKKKTAGCFVINE